MSVDQGQRAAPEQAVLRRSRSNRVIAGVCGGLGRYFGVDPVILRIAFVLLAVFGGSGVLLYIVALIAIPEESEGEAVGTAAARTAGRNGAVILGALLVALGALLLFNRVFPGLDQLFGPLLLVGVGAAVILAVRR